MNRSERLRDDYEDAMFALLMDKVAQEEGARLLEMNERLQQDPDAAVPEQIDRMCRETIRKNAGKRQRRRKAPGLKRVIVQALIVVLALVALFWVAYAAVPEVRVETLNTLIRISNVSSRLKLEKEGSNEIEADTESLNLFGYSVPSVSGPLSIIDSGEDRLGAWVRYSNGKGAGIDISILQDDGGIKYFDTEETESIEDIVIHGYNGQLIEKDGRIKVYWTDTDHDRYVEITGISVRREVVIKLAEGISYTGESW